MPSLITVQPGRLRWPVFNTKSGSYFKLNLYAAERF